MLHIYEMQNELSANLHIGRYQIGLIALLICKVLGGEVHHALERNCPTSSLHVKSFFDRLCSNPVAAKTVRYSNPKIAEWFQGQF